MAGFGGFWDAALAFPAVLFGFALVVVVGYWLAVLLGGAEIPGTDAYEGGEGVGTGGFGDTGETGDAAGFSGGLAALGLGGVPVTVVISLLVAIAWFTSLSGTALFDAAWLRVLTLPVALLAAWAGTRLLIIPLRRLAPGEVGISRADFVGRVGTIRTGRVGPGFGQAEVAAEDGSTAVVQVRAEGADAAGLKLGSSALLYDYDTEGEFFRVAPFGLGPPDTGP
ncbi:DUF1449 family protein [Streptomyces sp. JJ66]|uniref:hypothetical protein n=1 Tax=Streptomyces sp. JJ66 TaxID=2803843 RepID=UPI001C55F119|nr:hypothetical protein [Streptomyces sp. JJ66]MBW1603065.1 DUF1449 family protein [Streptomyces sp. JJ66]